MPDHYELSDFVSFEKDSRAGYTGRCSAVQEANIYRWLKEQGFGISEFGDELLIFRRSGEEILPASVISMKRNFLDFLETANFAGLENGVSRNDLINWFYDTPPLKRNECFISCLKEKLSTEESFFIRTGCALTFLPFSEICRKFTLLQC
ncbi:hypothetical protein D0C36_19505 [Mucilaginibacter conchicola]|uniref:Uncharacterized protein n=1 Tax=Mucilaginibacter conchicola TaxID=2303333 RepID=A0A372NR68_9SPHI|nr:hypothetical protein [Mucilaginibacter conchicola]RFZ91130.1 hypothetical protein D0C36_19505 [Mucilaginibacter conchicola]